MYFIFLCRYDRQKLTLKDITNVQYVACMNPTAGSFTINSRLQRHFSVFAVSFPGTEALRTIYYSILSQHIAQGGFSGPIQKTVERVVNAQLKLHQKVISQWLWLCSCLLMCYVLHHIQVAMTFLPTAVKFHYIFNLRDLSNIFQVYLCHMKSIPLNNLLNLFKVVCAVLHLLHVLIFCTCNVGSAVFHCGLSQNSTWFCTSLAAWDKSCVWWQNDRGERHGDTHKTPAADCKRLLWCMTMSNMYNVPIFWSLHLSVTSLLCI